MPGPTLDDLEGVVWGEPTFDSGLVIRCHELRTKPVDEFTLADLRLLIGQNVSLPILMPHAVAAIEADPLLEASGYPGDLLSAVLRSDHSFLRTHKDMLDRVCEAARRAAGLLRAGAGDLAFLLRCELLEEVETFLAGLGGPSKPLPA